MQDRKPYLVSRVQDRPNYDSAPVAKIVDYPLEERDYRPFAQCILCCGGDTLYLRMWAFEVSPPPTSALRCVLYLYPEKPRLAVCVTIEHGGGDQVWTELRPLEDGKPARPDASRLAPPLGITCRPHNGEDLQGVYWGMTVTLPVRKLEELGGATALAPGAVFPGNFYKLCEDGRFAHLGSWHPADFPADPYSRGSMGDFAVISY